MIIFRTTMLFVVTAFAEILGCYLPFLWLRQGKSPLLLIPAAMSLGVFSWLLTLHATTAGRTYAAYGGVYVAVSIVWLWKIEGIVPDHWDLIGAAVSLVGMGIVMFMPRGN